MITRLVRMRFREDAIGDFETLFGERKATIRSQPGCQQLKLWQDAHDPCVFFTYSIWDSETDLNRYRYSDFFKETWTLTKALFAAKAEAWSVVEKG